MDATHFRNTPPIELRDLHFVSTDSYPAKEFVGLHELVLCKHCGMRIPRAWRNVNTHKQVIHLKRCLEFGKETWSQQPRNQREQQINRMRQELENRNRQKVMDWAQQNSVERDVAEQVRALEEGQQAIAAERNKVAQRSPENESIEDTVVEEENRLPSPVYIDSNHQAGIQPLVVNGSTSLDAEPSASNSDSITNIYMPTYSYSSSSSTLPASNSMPELQASVALPTSYMPMPMHGYEHSATSDLNSAQYSSDSGYQHDSTSSFAPEPHSWSLGVQHDGAMSYAPAPNAWNPPSRYNDIPGTAQDFHVFTRGAQQHSTSDFSRYASSSTSGPQWDSALSSTPNSNHLMPSTQGSDTSSHAAGLADPAPAAEQQGMALSTSVDQINTSIAQINTSIAQISTSIEQINTSIEQINTSIKQINTAPGVMQNKVSSSAGHTSAMPKTAQRGKVTATNWDPPRADSVFDILTSTPHTEFSKFSKLKSHFVPTDDPDFVRCKHCGRRLRLGPRGKRGADIQHHYMVCTAYGTSAWFNNGGRNNVDLEPIVQGAVTTGPSATTKSHASGLADEVANPTLQTYASVVAIGRTEATPAVASSDFNYSSDESSIMQWAPRQPPKDPSIQETATAEPRTTTSWIDHPTELADEVTTPTQQTFISDIIVKLPGATPAVVLGYVTSFGEGSSTTPKVTPQTENTSRATTRADSIIDVITSPAQIEYPESADLDQHFTRDRDTNYAVCKHCGTRVRRSNRNEQDRSGLLRHKDACKVFGTFAWLGVVGRDDMDVDPIVPETATAGPDMTTQRESIDTHGLPEDTRQAALALLEGCHIDYIQNTHFKGEGMPAVFCKRCGEVMSESWEALEKNSMFGHLKHCRGFGKLAARAFRGMSNGEYRSTVAEVERFREAMDDL